MSSLRISHQNRGIGAPSASGDTGRSEHADAGASFAVALGAAAGVAPKDAVALFGGKPGDGGDFSSGPRKRTETPAKPNGPAAIAASTAGALIAAPTVAPAANGDSSKVAATAGSSGTATIAGTNGTATIACSDGSTALAGGGTAADARSLTASAGALAVSRSAPGAPSAIQNVAGKIAASSSQDVVPAAPTAAVTAAPVAIAPMPSPPGVIVTAHTDGISPAPALSSAGTRTPQTLPSPGDAPPIDIGVVVTTPGVSVSHIAPPVQVSAAPALPVGAVTSGIPNAATGGVAIDASGLAAPPTLALPIGSGAGTGSGTGAGTETPNIANIVTTLSPGLPSATAGQPVAADSGGFGFAPRDRFVQVASTPDAGGAAAASANAAAVDASAPTASSAASAPGLTPDASSADTIADQVAGQLARMVSNGSREMVMRLHPPELGDVTVRVTVSGRDVAAWFASPQPQVQSAISAAIGQLQTNLGNAGYNLNGAWVGADTSNARQQQGSSLPASPAPRAPPATVTALPATAAAVRSPSSGLNVYV